MGRNVLDDPLVLKAIGSSVREFKRTRRRAAVKGELVFAELSQHLVEVGELLARAGFGSEVVAAGLLHDHLEELPSWSESRLEREFGSGAAALVVWVTHENRRLPLSSRNEMFLAKLHLAPDAALAIVCADRISNMLSYNAEAFAALVNEGAADVGWCALPGPWPQALQTYESLHKLFRGRVPQVLFERYEEALSHLTKLAEEQGLSRPQHAGGEQDETVLREATAGRLISR